MIDVPAFRWFMISMFGHWSSIQMDMVVRGLLAYQITGSFAALGGVALAGALPRLVFGLFGGVVADRVSRRTVIQVTQVCSGLLMLTLAILLFTDTLIIEHVYAVSAIQGAVMTFSMPARQAMIPDLVGERRLGNAYGLNASGMNVMRLVGPATAGILVAAVGFAWVYTLMTALYVFAVVTMFWVPNVAPAARPESAGRGRMSRSGLSDIAEGLRYLRRNRILLMMLVVHLFVVILSLTFQRLAPGFVSDVLAADEHEAALRLGLILTVMGAGALLGSLIIASTRNGRRGRLLLFNIALFGVFLLAFAISESIVLSTIIAFGLGVAQAGRQSLSQILIQTHTENAYRGRISSIMMMEMGFESFGTFAISLLAVALGAQFAFGTVAVLLLLLTVIVWFFLPAYRNLP